MHEFTEFPPPFEYVPAGQLIITSFTIYIPPILAHGPPGVERVPTGHLTAAAGFTQVYPSGQGKHDAPAVVAYVPGGQGVQVASP
jgi:hypothetical protein